MAQAAAMRDWGGADYWGLGWQRDAHPQKTQEKRQASPERSVITFHISNFHAPARCARSRFPFAPAPGGEKTVYGFNTVIGISGGYTI
jgi:hypothetical protein